MNAFKIYCSALADAFLAGDSDLNALKSRGQRCLGSTPAWLENLCQGIIQHNLLHDTDTLTDYICHYEPLRNAWFADTLPRRIAYYFFPTPQPTQPAPFVDQSIIRLATFNDLCEFFQLDENHLLWLSDPWGSTREHSQGPLQHYVYRWVDKKNSESSRLLEIPKARLKTIQRKIHQELLSKIPAHPDSHGFVKGRSIVSYTSAHLDKQWILRLDLEHFFPSISYPRIFTIFSSLGYRKPIARHLSLLCTNRVPRKILGNKITDWRFRKTMMAPHLPQGAPTSPALANLAAFNLDCRLSALAKHIDSSYSRYADDMLFSGNSYRNLNSLIPYIGHILAEEGFHMNYRKTRVMGAGQRQIATGIVLNKHHNLPRQEYDRLKAILHNCVCKGVESQNKGHPNFYAFLKGKLNYLSMLNPSKAKKLEAMFLQIDWSSQ